MIEGSIVQTLLIDHAAKAAGRSSQKYLYFDVVTIGDLPYALDDLELPIRRDLQKPTGAGTQESTAQLKSLLFQL
jgi:hypothetical protein